MQSYANMRDALAALIDLVEPDQFQINGRPALAEEVLELIQPDV